MRNKKASLAVVLSLLMGCFTFAPSISASPANGNTPFPIGIWWPPGPEETTDGKYAEISGMNVNFVVGGNGIRTFESTDQALALSKKYGMRMLVTDYSFDWLDSLFSQSLEDDQVNVTNTSAWGQTFRTPASEAGVVIKYVDLKLDKSQWTSNQKLTLKVYTNSGKTGLVATSERAEPMTGAGEATRFEIDVFILSNTSYYFELTSDSPASIPLATSLADVYADGHAYLNGSAYDQDLWFTIGLSHRSYNDNRKPDPAEIADVVAHYANRSEVMGYHIIDEPTVKQMARVDDVVKQVKSLDPDKLTYVNLNPNYATLDLLGMDFNFSGEFVSSVNPVGQTFKTRADQHTVEQVQWWIGGSSSGTWETDEALTVTLWDSPAKNEQIASYTIDANPGTDWPQFQLNASVQPSTVYYMELTHNGLGNDSIGWVTRSNTGTKWYSSTSSAYVNGTKIQSDFWFTVDQNIEALTYEDYVYRWVSTQPDVLVYDHYPFLTNGSVHELYYPNLEVIRDQALGGSVDFWSYLQSVGINNWLRMPSENDMRYQIYTNLAYGAKGFIYFTYTTPFGDPSIHDAIILPDGTRNISYDWAKDLNAEVLNLGGALTKLTSQAVYHTGSLPAATTALPDDFFWQPDDKTKPIIVSYFKDDQNREYVMIVNRDSEVNRTLSFTLSSNPAAIKEVSKVTGMEIDTNYNPGTGKMTAAFAPGEGKLYAIGAIGHAPVASDLTLTTSKNAAVTGALAASDQDGDALTYLLVTNGAKGTAVITNAATGEFTYTPHANETGADAFTFIANDGVNDSHPATVSVTITESTGGTGGGTGTGGTGGGTGGVTPPASGNDEETETEEPPAEPVVQFTDTTNHWAASSIQRAAQLGIVKGYTGGTFKPNLSITRAEFTVMLVNALQLQGEKAALTYRDKETIGAWAEQAIAIAESAGFIKGYADGSFRPNEPITRAQMAVILARVLALKGETPQGTASYADERDIASWAKAGISAVSESGIMQGRGGNKFVPNAETTRAEAVTVILRLIERHAGE